MSCEDELRTSRYDSLGAEYSGEMGIGRSAISDLEPNRRESNGRKAVCSICPHHCALGEGQTGLCRARRNLGGAILSETYGVLSALALDPIEKKPLRHFYPGSRILSVGSYGCNMRCPFCQNSGISMIGPGEAAQEASPEQLVDMAMSEKRRGNIGLAYTYNEPLVGYEFVLDCAKLAAEAGLRNVLVTNGYICSEPLHRLLPYIHGMNIDLKSFREVYYRKLGGDLETIKETIQSATEVCHVEITTLIVPGENDSEGEIEEIAKWLAGISKAIPYHISRFFPRWQMAEQEPTPIPKVYALADIARKHLQYVYEGNC
ncbi:MAG: AmmeMemoRadiSam system radical SAM enzyme [Clostridiales bacterium]|nr:AmmeMemoRadiSam system radical SAM enzyme [Clostridiales bacterium]